MNELLHVAQSRAAALHASMCSVMPQAASIIRRTAGPNAASEADSVLSRATRILGIWRDRSVVDAATLAAVQSALTSGDGAEPQRQRQVTVGRTSGAPRRNADPVEAAIDDELAASLPSSQPAPHDEAVVVSARDCVNSRLAASALDDSCDALKSVVAQLAAFSKLPQPDPPLSDAEVNTVSLQVEDSVKLIAEQIERYQEVVRRPAPPLALGPA
jgi:hypothetical protein